MGSSFNTIVYKDYNDKTKKQIEDKWNDEVENSLHLDGHSYSGGVGMLGKGFRLASVTVESLNEAEDFLADHHEKWSSALGVRFKREGRIDIMIGGYCSS